MLTKNFHLCFSKIKCIPSSLSPPLTLEHDDDIIHDHHYNSAYDLSSSSASSSPPDFSTTFASRRFFVSSPGRSNSILDSLSSSTDPTTEILVGGLPVSKYSPDPFSDFRVSMQEMVEDRERLIGGSLGNDCEYLQELLETYISLNSKETHKFIIGAFVDLLVSLLDSDSQLY